MAFEVATCKTRTAQGSPLALELGASRVLAPTRLVAAKVIAEEFHLSEAELEALLERLFPRVPGQSYDKGDHELLNMRTDAMVYGTP